MFFSSYFYIVLRFFSAFFRIIATVYGFLKPHYSIIRFYYY